MLKKKRILEFSAYITDYNANICENHKWNNTNHNGEEFVIKNVDKIAFLNSSILIIGVLISSAFIPHLHFLHSHT